MAPTARVVLYGRSGCHLCAAARAVLAGIRDDTGEPFVDIDIDTAGDPTLLRRWTDQVPVVTVDDRVVDILRIDPQRVTAALRARPPN